MASYCFDCKNFFNSPTKLARVFDLAADDGRNPFLSFILNIILNIEKSYIVIIVFVKRKGSVLFVPQQQVLKMFTMNCTSTVWILINQI